MSALEVVVEQTCAGCRFWKRASGASVGYCHRRAPSIGRLGRGVWPETRESDTCGCWKAPEVAAPASPTPVAPVEAA
jgi:hypothetical protein